MTKSHTSEIKKALEIALEYVKEADELNETKPYGPYTVLRNKLITIEQLIEEGITFIEYPVFTAEELL